VIRFDTSLQIFDKIARNKQIKHKTKELNILLDEMTSTGFTSELFRPSISINENQIFVAGHSHGGITALVSGASENRWRGVISLDPWLYPFSDEIMSGELSYSAQSPPLLIINTETFAQEQLTFSKGVAK